MAKLFGTDGIRGKANQYPLTPEMAVKIGRAVADYCDGNAIVMGRDTRISGHMLVSAVGAGISSTGMDVNYAGVLPTPAVARLTSSSGAAAGIMISASHNPYYDNGIKVFTSEGYKMDDHDEAEIERRIGDSQAPHDHRTDLNPGRIERYPEAVEAYIDFLLETTDADVGFKNMKIVLDCANGAASGVATTVFSRLGAEVVPLCVNPDGININADCGSEHTQKLAETVLKTGADAGLAFDGDADRLIAVDETGQRLTGDQVLAACARMLKNDGKLSGNTVVSTVMSNIGLKQALAKMDIAHVECDVGDRRVMEKMRAVGAVLGGEDSGHTIFARDHTTGDGILSGLKLVRAMRVRGESLSEIKKCMSVFPQEMVNVAVKEKPELKSLARLSAVIEKIEKALGQEGRVLVRYSGTQPICRVMVEGPTPDTTRAYAEEIADIVKQTIG